jgi:GT2 family glycosyltransferase
MKNANSLSVSIAIPTKDRHADLADCLASISRQTRLPDEVVVIEGGKSIIGSNNIPQGLMNTVLVHFPESSGLTASRNKALALVSKDIVIFLDDDLVLDEHFVEKITEPFGVEAFAPIGGVVGNMSNYSPEKDDVIPALIRRIFLLPMKGDGKFRLSGAPTFVYGQKQIKEVEFIAGGITAYRREIFDEYKFDENLKGPSLGEDDDLSFRISRKYRNYYTPFALALHKQSSANRTTGIQRVLKRCGTYLYLAAKNRNPVYWPFTLIMVFGILLESFYFLLKKVFKAIWIR